MKIIEATLIMPVTCLIVISLIGLMMSFYNDVSVQIAKHDEDRTILYNIREVTVIRASNAVKQNNMKIGAEDEER